MLVDQLLEFINTHIHNGVRRIKFKEMELLFSCVVFCSLLGRLPSLSDVFVSNMRNLTFP
jgi:hypothetical protein